MPEEKVKPLKPLAPSESDLDRPWTSPPAADAGPMTAEQSDWKADLLDTGAEFILINGERHWAHDAKEIVRLHNAQLAEKEREIEPLKNKCDLMIRQDREEVWYWADDGEDHPESLACPALIKPDVVRRFVAAEQRLKEAQAFAKQQQNEGYKVPALEERLRESRTGAAVVPAYVAAQLRRYADHDPSCPEFKQKANRHNKGLVEDSAWPCNCGSIGDTEMTMKHEADR